QGKVTKFLERLANSAEFKRATNNGIRDDRMADRECVLRFLAFTIASPTVYKAQDFDSFLSDRMAEINQFSDKKIEDLAQQFLRTMQVAFVIFGLDTFRKRYNKGAARYPINKALFEAWSVNINRLDDSQLHRLQEQKDMVRERFIPYGSPIFKAVQKKWCKAS